MELDQGFQQSNMLIALEMHTGHLVLEIEIAPPKLVFIKKLPTFNS